MHLSRVLPDSSSLMFGFGCLHKDNAVLTLLPAQALEEMCAPERRP